MRLQGAAALHWPIPHLLAPLPAIPSAGGWFSGLFGAGSRAREESTAAAAAAVEGLYMYGGVGVGKTMLMDLLVKEAPPYFQASGWAVLLCLESLWECRPTSRRGGGWYCCV